MQILVSLPRRGKLFASFFPPETVALAERLFTVVWNDTDTQLTKDELREKLKNCDAYVACWGAPALTAEVLEGADRLKLLVSLGSTIAPYVSDAMWARGIRAISGFDLFSRSTAEGAIAYMLTALRDIPRYTRELREEHVWPGSTMRNDGLLYKSVGVISYGNVARHLVRMLQGFEVDLRVYDIVEIPADEQQKYGFRQCSIEEIFSQCDIISIHTPYNAHTHHLVNDHLLSMIKKDALLVNTARGEVIDQTALTTHLKNGDFRAALDVFEKEPLPIDDPLFDTHPSKALLIPHMAGVTTNLRARVTRDMLSEAHNFLVNGAPLRNEISAAYAGKMSKH